MPKMKTDAGSASKERPATVGTGWSKVVSRKEAIDSKTSEGFGIRDFWLKDGESAKVQFLTDEPYCYDAHNVRDKRGNFNIVPCQLAAQKYCVICQDGVKQTWRAAFKVLDYRGNWDKDKKRFKYDEPIEKVWKVGQTIAIQLKNLTDKKGRALSEMVLEISRSGSGASDTTYNFEIAFNEETERREKPIEWEEKFPEVDELCEPPTDEALAEMGFETLD